MIRFDHELKCKPPYFQAVLNGDKTFEIRKDDRNGGFKQGQILLLREFDTHEWAPDGYYTGRALACTVTYKTDFAQEAGYVVLGIGSVRDISEARAMEEKLARVEAERARWEAKAITAQRIAGQIVDLITKSSDEKIKKSVFTLYQDAGKKQP